MRLDDALDQLSEIHAHVLRGAVFRGYRSGPIAATALLALTAATVQSWLAPPTGTVSFAVAWLTVALASTAVCAFDLWVQARHVPARVWQRRTMPVLCQSLPALTVGGLLTWLFLDGPRAGLLPGLWSMLFGLAVFSARPYLPRAVGWVSAWYVLAGVVVLASNSGANVPSPWSMGVPFAVGQALLALVLKLGLERSPSPAIGEGGLS